jgi:polynucleotide 5'-kinase involved in rRNA processing
MIHITSFRDIEDSILAFVDHAGFVLALGILIDIKLQEKKLIVKTALEDAGQIAWIEMSELTFNPYGPPA